MTDGLEIDSRELQRTFSRLADNVKHKVSRRAVNAGATPIVKAAEAEAPELSGRLKASIGKKTKAYKQSETSVAIVGPRMSGQFQGHHGHLVENGFVAVNGNFIPGNPFMKRATESAEAQAMQKMQAKLAEAINKEAGA